MKQRKLAHNGPGIDVHRLSSMVECNSAVIFKFRKQNGRQTMFYLFFWSYILIIICNN